MRRLSSILYNFHWVVEGEAARSAQAYAGFLRRFLRQRKIRTVVNLRGSNPQHLWWRYETEVCKDLQIKHCDISVNSRTLPSREILLEILDTFDASPKPLLIKCSGGQDRTSLGAALYIVHNKGWAAISDAMGQFAKWPYLHLPKRNQRWLRYFLVYAEQEAKGRPLIAWIRSEYAPERFMAWLDAQGLHDVFRNLPNQHARVLKNGLPAG